MKLIPPASVYARAFELECAEVYPVMDTFEATYGYAVDRKRLEDAARVLACPVKAHPPNWQHGRLIYARTRAYLAGQPEQVTLLDIGTAKGFSALCLLWALQDAGVPGRVVSVDVIDPASHARRNTVAECDGLKTLAELLAPWPEAREIVFLHSTGEDWLATSGRVHVAWVDGKHAEDVVSCEGDLLAQRQQPGDVALFDDLQIPGVKKAISGLADLYDMTTHTVLQNRSYAVGVRR